MKKKKSKNIVFLSILALFLVSLGGGLIALFGNQSTRYYSNGGGSSGSSSSDGHVTSNDNLVIRYLASDSEGNNPILIYEYEVGNISDNSLVYEIDPSNYSLNGFNDNDIDIDIDQFRQHITFEIFRPFNYILSITFGSKDNSKCSVDLSLSDFFAKRIEVEEPSIWF